MEQFATDLNYGNFVDLLHAFYLWHGENPAWSRVRLQGIFALIEGDLRSHRRPRIPIKYVVALVCIRAFGTLHGGAKAREIWELLRPWLEINENVAESRTRKVDGLEAMVKTFEAGRTLDWRMAGGRHLYRVMDWKTQF